MNVKNDPTPTATGLASASAVCPPGCLGALRGRCLFRNDCLCVRLLELPGGRAVGGQFAGCRGLLVVSFGRVELQREDGTQVLREGDSCLFRCGDTLCLRSEEWADVLFFEELAEQAA